MTLSLLQKVSNITKYLKEQSSKSELVDLLLNNLKHYDNQTYNNLLLSQKMYILLKDSETQFYI